MSSCRDSHQSTQFYGSSFSAIPANPSHHPAKRMLLHRKSKDKQEDDESQATPDSTTEPPKPMHDFQEGDDVFFHNDEGQNILGTIGQVTPLRCQILFGDGTQQWSVYTRIKKLSSAFDEPSPAPRSLDDSSSSVPEWNSNQKGKKSDLTCIVCKIKKKVSSKKVGMYNSKNPFKCARCTALKAVPASCNSAIMKIGSANESANSFDARKINNLPHQIVRRPSPCSGAIVSANISNSNSNLASVSDSLGVGRGISMELCNRNNQAMGSNNSNLQSMPSGQQQQPNYHSHSGSPPLINGLDGLSPGITVKKMRTSVPVQLKTSPIKSSKNNLCFHCGDRTCPYDRVHCNMCERYCHLMCLALTPPPLEGDKFWDVMCSACGTQNGSEKSPNRVFSVRRNVNSWSDVVHLIINCLKVKSMGQQYFDFDSQILPFLDSNMDKLHLPRQYKAVSREERKSKLLAALTDSRLRFTKHKDKLPSPLGGHEATFWALRSDQSKSNPGSPDVTPMRPFPTTSKSLTISPLTPNGVQDSLRPKSVHSDSNTSSDNSSLSISPNSSLPTSLKNRTNASPGSSPALSIFPIPNPNYSNSSNSNSMSSYVGSSHYNGSMSPSYPRVMPKEALLRSPITTNIVLSPTSTSTTSVATGHSKVHTPPRVVSDKKVNDGSSATSKCQSPQNSSVVVDNVRHDSGSDSLRQKLRIRLPLKQPAGKSETNKQSEGDSPKKKSLPAPAKLLPPGTTLQPKPPVTLSLGPRKRPLSSEEEDGDDLQVKKPQAADTISSGRHEIKSIGASPVGRAIKSADPPDRSPSKGSPPVSPLRLSIPRGRQKLLRSSVLKNKLANKSGKVIGKGRGRPPVGNRIVSPLRKEPFPGYNAPHISTESSQQEDLGKGERSNGSWKSDCVKLGKLRRVVSTLPPSTAGDAEGSELNSVEDELKIFNNNLVNAALLSGMRIECLPNDKPEKCKIAQFLLSESEIVHHSVSDDEIENFPGWARPQKTVEKPLTRRGNFEDPDSYEIVARKIGPDGIIRHLVVWREPTREGEKDFDDEIERLFFEHERSKQRSFGNGIKEEKVDRDFKPLSFTGLISSSEEENNKPELKPTVVTSSSSKTSPSASKVGVALSSPGKIAAAFMSATNKISAALSSPPKSSAPNTPVSMSSMLPCIIDLTDSS